MNEPLGRDKLVVLPALEVDQAAHPGLSGLSESFLYGLMAKLSLFTEIQVRDLAVKADRHQVEVNARNFPNRLQFMQHMATSNRARYVLTAILKPFATTHPSLSASEENTPEPGDRVSPNVMAVRLNLMVYDAQENRFAVNDSRDLVAFESAKPSSSQAIAPVMTDFNHALTWGAIYLLNLLTPEQAPRLMASVAAHELGRSYLALEKLISAEKMTHGPADKIVAYEHAVQADARLETAYYHLGRLYKSIRDYPTSILNFRKALEVSTACDRVKSMYAIDAGICCALLEQHEQAVQWWLKAIAYNPSTLNPYLNIAHTYEEQEDLERAEVFFRKAQMLAPGDTRIYYNLARIYSKKGEWSRALAQYQLQLLSDKNDPWCHSNIATCYLQLGDTRNAQLHFEQTVALDPDGEAGEYAKLILMRLSVAD
jgi:tetratricopeptide (TPR) repeat protein